MRVYTFETLTSPRRLEEFVPEMRDLGPEKFTQTHPYPVLLRRDSLAVDESAEFHTSFMQRNDARSPTESGMLPKNGAAGTVYPVLKRQGGAFAERIGIGRARNADVSILLPKISKYHAYFTQAEDGSWSISDAGSKNGTQLEGKRLEPRVPHAIRDAQEIAFGPYRFHFYTPAGFAEIVERRV